MLARAGFKPHAVGPSARRMSHALIDLGAVWGPKRMTKLWLGTHLFGNDDYLL